MKLTGKVIEVHSSAQYGDGLPRVTVLLNEGTGPIYNRFLVPNVDHLKLDDEVELAMDRVKEAADV